MSDIVEQLRDPSQPIGDYCDSSCCDDVKEKAAAEIERLREEINRLKEEKAADWKACSESALAASVEINNLRAMVREFVHRS